MFSSDIRRKSFATTSAKSVSASLTSQDEDSYSSWWSASCISSQALFLGVLPLVDGGRQGSGISLRLIDATVVEHEVPFAVRDVEKVFVGEAAVEVTDAITRVPVASGP